MRVPVQTSFGLALLPLPVTIEPEPHPSARSGASERAREEAFYQGFPEGPSRPPSEWKLPAALVSLRRRLSRRLTSLRGPSRTGAPSPRR